MVGEEEILRESAEKAWQAFVAGWSSCDAVHPDCAATIITVDGDAMFGKWHTSTWPDHLLKNEIHVQYVKISPTGLQSCASVQIKLGTEFVGFFVFLKEGDTGTFSWKCISVAIGPILKEKILPSTYEQVNALTWDGYCHANSICDGNLMAKSFHIESRLTFTGPDKRITICESGEFYEKVSGRYENEGPHQPYKHLKDDPRLGDANTLLSIEFGSAQLAMVTLKVGHPPFLWTDFLTCARINENGKPKWWIIHKSSDNEPHPLSR